MKRRPGLCLAISKIFRILIVPLRMTGNSTPVRVIGDSPNLFYRRFFYLGKKFIRSGRRWDINYLIDTLI
jgi:hypothetical protein